MHSAENDAGADPCVCDPNGPCLGVPGDTIGCDACLALDPEEACIHDCDGSGECIATLHVHGCFADRDGARCDSPTEHYDRARGNLDRHGVHFLTAYVAGV